MVKNYYKPFTQYKKANYFKKIFLVPAIPTNPTRGVASRGRGRGPSFGNVEPDSLI